MKILLMLTFVFTFAQTANAVEKVEQVALSSSLLKKINAVKVIYDLKPHIVLIIFEKV